MSTDLRLTDEQLEELRRTGSPLVVRLGERTEVVIQDADAYRRMIELLNEIDLVRSAQVCAERWQALQDGSDTGIKAEDFFAELRQRLMAG